MSDNSRSPSPLFPRDCEWSTIDLEKYNIVVKSSQIFDSTLPLDALPPLDASNYLRCALYVTPPPDPSEYYLRYVTHAHHHCSEDRSSLDDLIIQTLKVAGFQERGTTIQKGYSIVTCDDTTDAPLQVCLFHRYRLILLLACRTYYDWEHTAVKEILVTQAIAAYRHNNAKRTDKGLKPLDAMVFPCISIHDLQPTFYFIPITMALSTAVMHGQSPSTTTTILESTVPRPKGAKWCSMKDPTYRPIALACFKVFRGAAKLHWEKFFEGFA
ncbi:hypothetical protein H0H92_013640 [Tricholoma furcatifolium]|nr:hypothetical protein H0H92_013640 [Tricholoma furcatifolium]